MQPGNWRLAEIIIAASVVVISVASLFVAVHQSTVMERSLAASVWPIMEYRTGNYDDAREEARLSFEFTNSGLGPAQVRWGAFYYEDRAYGSIFDLLIDCCIEAEGGREDRREVLNQMLLDSHLPVITNNIRNSVLTPGQTIVYANMPMPDDEAAQAVWRQLDTARQDLEVELCYCSVFEDCWMARLPGHARQEIRVCPAGDE